MKSPLPISKIIITGILRAIGGILIVIGFLYLLLCFAARLLGADITPGQMFEMGLFPLLSGVVLICLDRFCLEKSLLKSNLN